MAQRFRCYISVGHGGSDPGASGKNEATGKMMRESKINLNVAFAVRKRLQAAGVEVMMSREDDDTFRPIADMVKEAKEFGATHLLAIHHNAGGGDGWEVLHQPTPESERWADIVGRQLRGLNNAHGKNPTYVSNRSLGIMKSKIKTILTEAFFLDTDDVKAIDEWSEQDKEGNAIAYGTLQDMGLR